MWVVSQFVRRKIVLLTQGLIGLLVYLCLFFSIELAAEEFQFDLQDDHIQEEFEFRTEEIVLPTTSGDIPSQNNRSEGPRILINQIRFARLPEFPELGITRESVARMVETQRQQLMLQDLLFENGFTPEELEQVGDFLEPHIDGEDNAAELNLKTVRGLVRLLRRQRSVRGLTFNDIEAIASQVTNLYRKKGMFLAKAYVPAQEVEDGVVFLSVYEGRLGKILTDKKEIEAGGYNAELITASLNKLVGKVVTSEEIEREIYLLNDYAGVSAFGFFSRGDALGETNLKIRFREQEKWALSTRVDNHGTKFSGDRRLFTVFDWHSPLGRGDELSLGYLKSVSFDSDLNIGASDVGLFSYSLPLTPRTGVKISTEFNEFDLNLNPDGSADALEDSGLARFVGSNQSVGLSFWHKLSRSRTRNITLGVEASEKQTLPESNLSGFDTHTQGIEISVNSDFLSEDPKVLNIFNARLKYGLLISDVMDNRQLNLYSLRLDASSLLFLSTPFLDYETRLLLNSRVLYSESSLPGFDRLSLGGSTAVRGFTTADFSADKALFTSVEWYLPLPERFNFNVFGQPANNILQLGLFYDFAVGQQNSVRDGRESIDAKLGGGGLLVKLAWHDRFSTQISFSKPTTGKVDGELQLDERSVRTYIDFSYKYK